MLVIGPPRERGSETREGEERDKGRGKRQGSVTRARREEKRVTRRETGNQDQKGKKGGRRDKGREQVTREQRNEEEREYSVKRRGERREESGEKKHRRERERAPATERDMPLPESPTHNTSDAGVTGQCQRRHVTACTDRAGAACGELEHVVWR